MKVGPKIVYKRHTAKNHTSLVLHVFEGFYMYFLYGLEGMQIIDCFGKPISNQKR